MQAGLSAIGLLCALWWAADGPPVLELRQAAGGRELCLARKAAPALARCIGEARARAAIHALRAGGGHG
ncbi:hypothetical protein [Coralloluteibacterium thermophilus]|uniref:Uncharacterized protein n=1 Tax=Coralloluteibacterium thermophilum TaxID=2707049 RepID=A0ABV9NFX4_9GAMM